MKIPIPFPARLGLVVCILAIASAPRLARAAAWYQEDFSEDVPGQAPGGVRVSGGPGYRALVTGAETDPADPFTLFAGDDNRSLLLENTTRNASSGATFTLPAPALRGALEIEFYFVQDYDETLALLNPMLQISLPGTPFFMYLRAARFVQARDGGETVTLDPRATVNAPNLLVIDFDVAGGAWSGWLNGRPLARGGERTRFAWDDEAHRPVSSIYMRPGSSGASGARVFINRVTLREEARPVAPRAPGRNMLPNADFSQTAAAREIYPALGDYRAPAQSGWTLDRDVYHAGSQSLRMDAGSAPFFWQAFDNRSRSGSYRSRSVFSVYLKGARTGQRAEIGYEVSGFSDGGQVQTARGGGPQTVTLRPEWQRFDLPIDVTASWEAGTIPPHGVRLHRAWVRPDGADPLWVDAAQLETDRTEASPFLPQRLNNDLPIGRILSLGTRVWADPKGPRDPLPAPPENDGTLGSVALTVMETCGFARRAEPVRGGIPFPEGTLFDARRARLRDASGSAIPAQFTPLAHWGRDGSIRSLGIDFQIDLEAGATAGLRLLYGEPPEAPAGTPIAEERADSIVIDTGALRAVIRKDAFRGFDALAAGGEERILPVGAGSRIVGLDGIIYDSASAPPDEVVIEDNGPLRATVLVRGRHADPEGTLTRLYYEVRIHAFAGKAFFTIEYAVENAEPVLHTPVEAIALRLPRGTATGGRFGWLDGAAQDFSTPLLAVQRQQHDGPSRYDVVIEEDAEVRTIEPGRLAGWIETGDTALAVHDGWQLHPFAFEVSEGLDFHFWPPRHVRAVDLPYGVSMHARLVYAPFGAHGAIGNGGTPYLAGPAEATRRGPRDTLGSEPPLLHVDPAWVAASGVFGSFLSAEETAEFDPGFEQRLREYSALVARDQDLLDLTGQWNYGCNGTPQRWGNNEHTVCRNLWMQWLRSGDPTLYRRAWISTRHIREIDLCFGGPGARAQHYHFAGTHHVPHFGLGHYWITGLVWHYLLTGDRRSHDVARDAGAQGIMGSTRQEDGRGRARLLYVMAELYELTRLRVFREAFETQYAFGVPTPLNDYHGGKNLMLMAKWHETTGDPAVLDRLREDAGRLIAWHRERPPYGWGGRNVPTLASGLAEVARITGERRYVLGIRDRLYWSSLHPRFDINAVRVTEYLYQARRLGGDGPTGIPAGIWGLASATGRGSTFRFRLQPRPGQPAVIRVHRVSHREGDSVLVRAQPGNGGEEHEYVLEGDDWLTRELRFPLEEGKPAVYEVFVQSRRDGRFEISSDPATVLLEPGTRFRMRQGMDIKSGFRFYILPAAGREAIAIALRWPSGRDEGAGVGARLEDIAGNPVAHARWIVPFGTSLDSGGRPASGRTGRLLLPIPPEQRGSVLRLCLQAPAKDLEWRIEDDEDLRLAIDPAAFADP